MKVDLGTCAACGAKNSKFVETCYKCGALLPWAPNYVAPTAKGAQPVLHPAPVPQPTASASDASQAVASAPFNKSGLSDAKRAVVKRAQERISVPIWAIAAGVWGCVVLGMGLVTLFGRGSTSSGLVPTPMPAVVVVATATPTAVTPSTTLVPTATSAPPAVIVSSAATPTFTPTQVAPTPTPAPSPPITAAQNVSFDAIYANTTQGTAAQRDAYWKTVQNVKVAWRGECVQIGSTPAGPLVLRCKSGSQAMLVTVSLSTPQTLPVFAMNQSVVVEGILQSYSAQGYTLSQGRVS